MEGSCVSFREPLRSLGHLALCLALLSCVSLASLPANPLPPLRSGQGTIRFKEELAHGGNAGLVNAVGWLEPLKQKYPSVSYADLFTYAGVVAVEAMGGPSVPFRSGRVDAMDPSVVTPDGRLPEADKGNPMATAKGLRDVFYRMGAERKKETARQHRLCDSHRIASLRRRMRPSAVSISTRPGFNDQEIVALSGAHALGRCHADYSGYVGPWQGTPTIFRCRCCARVPVPTLFPTLFLCPCLVIGPNILESRRALISTL